MATETKTEFAARCNVTPGRVSQWIAQGKIKPSSLEGEGRKARIIIAAALADLKRSLDVSQSIGLNGLGTKLNSYAAELAAPVQTAFATQRARPDDSAALLPAGTGESLVPAATTSELPRADDTAERIAREKLRQAEIQTRRVEREEALETGRYMLTDAAEAQIARTAGMVLSTVESGFNAIADALAAEFAIPRRDVLHTMTKAFRTVRESASRAFADKAAAIAAAEASVQEREDGDE